MYTPIPNGLHISVCFPGEMKNRCIKFNDKRRKYALLLLKFDLYSKLLLLDVKFLHKFKMKVY